MNMSIDLQAKTEVTILGIPHRDALQLGPGKSVWVVVKTHSCHLMGM